MRHPARQRTLRLRRPRGAGPHATQCGRDSRRFPRTLDDRPAPNRARPPSRPLRPPLHPPRRPRLRVHRAGLCGTRAAVHPDAERAGLDLCRCPAHPPDVPQTLWNRSRTVCPFGVRCGTCERRDEGGGFAANPCSVVAPLRLVLHPRRPLQFRLVRGPLVQRRVALYRRTLPPPHKLKLKLKLKLQLKLTTDCPPPSLPDSGLCRRRRASGRG
jgi:hypothetical protein